MDDYSGITVLITGIERLAAILDEFSPTLDCISPLDLEDVADHYATIAEIMQAPEKLKDLGDFAVLILESGHDIVLPISAFEPVKITIDELEESRNFDLKPEEIVTPAAALARNLAAEMIQGAYQQYRARKYGKQLRRKMSAENTVKSLAAQTITQNLKRVLHRSRSRNSQSSILTPLSMVDGDLSHSTIPTSTGSYHENQFSPPNDHQQNVTSPAKQHIPALQTPTQSSVLEVANVSVHSVPNVVWNDKNSLYIGIRIHDFRYRSSTQHGIGGEAIWEGTLCKISLQNLLSKHGKDAKLVVELYNEHLAIKDKLIGQCEFPCTQILDQMMNTPSIEMTGELMESPATTAISASRKFRGNFVCSFLLSDGLPSESNWTKSKEEKLSSDASVPQTARSRVIDVGADSIPEINGISPRTIRATADVLHAWETGNERASLATAAVHNVGPKPKKGSSLSLPRPKSAKTSGSKGHSKASTRLMEGISLGREPFHQHTEDTNRTNDDDNYDDEIVISGPSTARLSNITDENLTHDHATTAATSVTGDLSGRNEYHHNKSSSHNANGDSTSGKRTKRIHSIVHKSRLGYLPTVLSSSGNPTTTQDTIPTIVDVDCFFDKCFQMAFQTVCAAIELSALEIVILLDSLGHPIASHWLDDYGGLSLPASSGASAANHSQSNMSLPFPSIILPISHPAAFADAIVQYVQQYPELLDTTQYFRFEIDHASLALKHLIRLIKGNYDEIRAQIFQSSNYETDRQGIRKISGSVSSSTNTRSIRPSQYDQSSCQKCLRLLEIQSSIADIVSNGQVLFHLDASQLGNGAADISASGLPTLSSLANRISSMDSVASLGYGTTVSAATGLQIIPIRHLMRSALKRARFTVYQTTLRLIDAMWDKGVRPWDVYPPKHSPSNAAEQPKVTATAKTVLSSSQIDKATSVGMKRRKSRLSNTLDNRDGHNSSFIITDAGKLFEALVPLNRAYGFGYTLQELSQLANTVGGFLCLKDLIPAGANAPTAETTATNAASNAASSHSVWVKVLFPSKEIKRHAMQVLSILKPGLIRIRQRHSTSAPSGQDSIAPLSLRDTDMALNLTTDNTGDVDLLVSIPRGCLDSTSIGVSKLLQMSRGKLDCEDVHLGMRLRVVDFATLQRVCERFDWYDRPSVETMQKLAGHRVEVISIGELSSKGRLGVKLLRDDNVCDALPLEALQPLPSSATSTAVNHDVSSREPTAVADQTNVGDEKKTAGRRKSKSHRRGSRDSSVVNASVNPAPATTATLVADLAALQHQQSTSTSKTNKNKDKLGGMQSNAENETKNLANKQSSKEAWAENNVDKPPSLEKEKTASIPTLTVIHPKSEEEYDDDEEELPSPSIPKMSVHVSSPREQKSSMINRPQSATAATGTNTHPSASKTTNNNNNNNNYGSNSVKSNEKRSRPASASATSNRHRPHSTKPISNEEKDFSWLKPPAALVQERLSQDLYQSQQQPAMTLADILQQEAAKEDNDPRFVYYSKSPHNLHGSRPSATLHQWQPLFQADKAEYTPGVYVYAPNQTATRDDVDTNMAKNPLHQPAVEEDGVSNHHFTTFDPVFPSTIDITNIANPNATREGDQRPPASPTIRSPLRPSSAAVGGTGTTPPAVQRVAKKLKERQRQEREDQQQQHQYKKFQESPPASPPKDGGWGLSGYGYTNEGGRKDTSAMDFHVDEKFLEDPEFLARQTKVQQAKIKRDKNAQQNSKDASKGALKQLFGMNVGATAGDDSNERGPLLTISGDADGKGKQSQSLNGKANGSKSKRPKSATDQRPLSPQEERYRDIETARSAKEAAYKESYLLKQLKKLSV